MYPNRISKTQEDLVREVQQLEDSYAEALADDTDARTLSVLWNRIKTLNNQIQEIGEDWPSGPMHMR